MGMGLVIKVGQAGFGKKPATIYPHKKMSMTQGVFFICIVFIQLSELIHGSIIRPIVTRDIHAPSENEIIQNNNLYLIPDFEDIKVPDDFATDTSPESYQPPADILKLIFFNHNRLVKHISSLEKSPSPKDTPRQFDKNTKLQNLSLMLTIIQK